MPNVPESPFKPWIHTVMWAAGAGEDDDEDDEEGEGEAAGAGAGRSCTVGMMKGRGEEGGREGDTKEEMETVCSAMVKR